MAAHPINQVAPVHTHSPAVLRRTDEDDQDVQGSNGSADKGTMQQFIVGKLDAGQAILLGSRASLIEFPSLLLPQDVTAGSVVEISVKRNTNQERKNQQDFDDLQRDILDTFGRLAPVAPDLRLRAVTQTSVVLEWSRLETASASLLSLDIYRNGTRLAPIPNPVGNTSTKLSGLEVGAEYAFHLVLKTTAGTLSSNTIKTRTHTMTDTSGIVVCLGAIDGGGPAEEPSPEGESISQLESVIRDLLSSMGAKVSNKLQIDTTHYICTTPRPRGYSGQQQPNGTAAEGPVYRKALHLNIPVVRPEWIVACHENKKMMPISAFYIDADPPNHASVQKLVQQRSSRRQEQPEPPAPAPKDDKPPPPPPPPTSAADSVPEPPLHEGVPEASTATAATTTTTATDADADADAAIAGAASESATLAQEAAAPLTSPGVPTTPTNVSVPNIDASVQPYEAAADQAAAPPPANISEAVAAATEPLGGQDHVAPAAGNAEESLEEINLGNDSSRRPSGSDAAALGDAEG